jgi:hypothetical protein
VSAGAGGVGEALARAAAWLVEPVAAPAEPPTILDRLATVPLKQERETEPPVAIREARVGPMEFRARPMELRLVASPTEPKTVAPAVAEPAKAVELPARPVVAIVGLTPGCGATTLARALAATLARRDHAGAAVVASMEEPAGSNLSTRAATRLASRLASSHSSARAAGRLCLIAAADPAALAGSIARLAPLVLDLPPSGAAAASLAHLAIVIAAGHSEPALAELAATTLAAGPTQALTVVGGADDQRRWDQRAFLVLPRSRLGARLASAGWEPRSAFGAAVARIADACEEAACG